MLAFMPDCARCHGRGVAEPVGEIEDFRAEVARLKAELARARDYAAGPTWDAHREAIATAREEQREACAQEFRHYEDGDCDSLTGREIRVTIRATPLDATPLGDALAAEKAAHEATRAELAVAREETRLSEVAHAGSVNRLEAAHWSAVNESAAALNRERLAHEATCRALVAEKEAHAATREERDDLKADFTKRQAAHSCQTWDDGQGDCECDAIMSKAHADRDDAQADKRAAMERVRDWYEERLEMTPAGSLGDIDLDALAKEKP